MKRGEIWLINLDPTIGAEIAKKRPALIINEDGVGRLPLRIIAPHHQLEAPLPGRALDGTPAK